MQRPLLFASIVTLEPELLMILPVLHTQGNAGLLIFALNPLQGLHGQSLAKPSQPVSALRLGLGTQPQSPSAASLLARVNRARASPDFSSSSSSSIPVRPRAPAISPIPGQLDLGISECDQPVAAQEIGAELGHQTALGSSRTTRLGQISAGKADRVGMVPSTGALYSGLACNPPTTCPGT